MACRHLHRGFAVPSSAARYTACGALTIGWLCGLSVPLCHAQTQPTTVAVKSVAKPVEDPEIKLGREVAEDNDKHVKLVSNSAILERVNRIGQEIAAVANKMTIPAGYGDSKLKQFNYTFKVVDDRDVNAYSLPGGYIYVNKGLLDYVHSDDELAGVLAHEISHAAHHHMMKLLSEQKKIDKVLLPLEIGALAMILSGRGGGGQAGAGLLEGGQLYNTAKLNGYGVEAEKDADHTGMMLMTHTRYNPVGLYTFQIRLAGYERSKIAGELGIFRTHPPGPERAAAAKKELEDLNIPIYISEVDPVWRATVTAYKIGQVDFADVKLRDVVLCRVTDNTSMSAQQRADKLAKQFTSMFDRQLQPFEIRVNHDQTSVLARGVPVLTAADAAVQNKTLDTMSHELADAVTLLNQKQQIEMAY
jgi:beta-barrel assembly-enhancing protease